MSHERGDLPRGYSYVDGRTGLMGYEYVDPRTGIGGIRFGPRPKRKKTVRLPARRAAIAPDSARFSYVDGRTGIMGTGKLGSSTSRNEYGESADSGNEYAPGGEGIGFSFKVKNLKRPGRFLRNFARSAAPAAVAFVPLPGGSVFSRVKNVIRPKAKKPAPLPPGVKLQRQATPDGGSQVVAVDAAGAVVSKPIPSSTVIASGLPVIAELLPANQPQAVAPAAGIDSGGGSVQVAANVLSFADKLREKASGAAQTIRDVEERAAGYANRAADVLDRSGQVVSAATNAGVATAATGDSASGQLVGALMANPALLVGAGIGTYLLWKSGSPARRR